MRLRLHLLGAKVFSLEFTRGDAEREMRQRLEAVSADRDQLQEHLDKTRDEVIDVTADMKAAFDREQTTINALNEFKLKLGAEEAANKTLQHNCSVLQRESLDRGAIVDRYLGAIQSAVGQIEEGEEKVALQTLQGVLP